MISRGGRRALALVAVVSAASLPAVVAGCHRDADAPAAEEDDDSHAAPVEVTCEPVAAAATHARVALRGVVGVPPDRSAIVSAAVPGRVVDIRVHEGDHVTAGQLLATIDDPALGPATAEAESATTAAAAALASADSALARAQRLVDQGIAPRRDVEEAVSRRAAAAAELATAASHRDLARTMQGRARAVAPIPGVVVHVLRHAGELVDGTPTTPLVEIADPTVLELRADVPASQLVHLEVGQAGQVVLDALPDQPIPAELVAVSPAVDPATALGSVRAKLPVLPAGVHVALGLAGSLAIDLPRPAGGVSVPAVAVRRGNAGAEQVVVCEGSAAKLVDVHVGTRDGDHVEITSGLAPGQRVVTSHVVGIEDGAAIVVHGASPGPVPVPSPASPAQTPAKAPP